MLYEYGSFCQRIKNFCFFITSRSYNVAFLKRYRFLHLFFAVFFLPFMNQSNIYQHICNPRASVELYCNQKPASPTDYWIYQYLTTQNGRVLKRDFLLNISNIFAHESMCSISQVPAGARIICCSRVPRNFTIPMRCVREPPSMEALPYIDGRRREMTVKSQCNDNKNHQELR
jgi:hypothetical protein